MSDRYGDLVELVLAANDGVALGLPIRLICPGTHITGGLSNRVEWDIHLSSTLTAAGLSDTDTESVIQHTRFSVRQPTHPNEPPVIPTVLTLRNATVQTASGAKFTVLFTRVRLDQVITFALGADAAGATGESLEPQPGV